MSAITEKDYLKSPKSYVDAQTVQASGIDAKICAQLLRSPEVRKSYVGFRLFVRRDDALAWLTAHAPDTPLPACLESTSRTRGPRASNALLPPTQEMKERLVPPAPPRVSERTHDAFPPSRMKEASEDAREKTSGQAPTGKEPVEKRRENYGDDQIRGFHAFLQGAKTKEDRTAIYEEIGASGQAVSQWFRRLGLPALGPVVPTPSPKKKGRIAKIESSPSASAERGKPISSPKERSRGKSVSGERTGSSLSIEAKETLIRLVYKLLLE